VLAIEGVANCDDKPIVARTDSRPTNAPRAYVRQVVGAELHGKAE